ncbi:MAG: cellulase family glycosylhydrolase [Bryobacterales bacterium]|nr:cellulase family glycosylhydrolase [Bryobacterales bacterium]
MMCRLTSILLAATLGAAELQIQQTRFYMDGRPFPYTGLSFFNAIYNPAFRQSEQPWLQKFRRYGINVLRVWAQWDSQRGYVDTCPTCTLYRPDGSLRMDHVARLKQILQAADQQGFVIELTLFSQESWHAGIRLDEKQSVAAASALARELAPFRNLTFQIWNEFSLHTVPVIQAIRKIDPKRLVTSSPGGAGVLLASPAESQLMDYFTPHTTRQRQGKPWEVGPAELQYLLKRFRKPVVDDEPARNGTASFGGPGEQTYPPDHMLQIYKVWQIGAYTTYHHDMFQTGYGSKEVPPSGIPDPEFSPYHRAVLEFIALQQRYAPQP